MKYKNRLTEHHEDSRVDEGASAQSAVRDGGHSVLPWMQDFRDSVVQG